MKRKTVLLTKLLKWPILSFLVYKLVNFIIFFKQKVHNAERLSKTYPIPVFLKSQMFGFMFGFIPALRKNFHRLYHFRIDIFDTVSAEHNRKIDTLQITTIPVMHNALISRDPRVVRHILKDDFDSFVKPETLRQSLRDFLGDGIFVVNHGSTSSSHEHWSFQRKTASKIFTKKIFNGHVYNVLLSNTDKVIKLLNDGIEKNEGGVIDLKKIFYAFTLDAIGDIGFGVDFDTLRSEKEVKFATAFDTIVQTTSTRGLRPLWRIFGRLYQQERQLHSSKRVLDKLAMRLIAERRTDTSIETKGDILSLFLKTDKGLSDKFLRDIIMSFMIAGRDTSACTLSFLFYLLATHEKVQQRLWTELNDYFNDYGVTTRASLDMLGSLPYLQAVVLEALRLFPPVPVDPKEAARESVLPGGISVPKGTIVVYEVFAMGRDPERYSEPGKFIPERWLGKGFPMYDQFEMPVFQAGNRFCLGKDLAVYEIKVLTIELLRRFKFVWPAKDAVVSESDVSYLNGELVYQSAITLSYKGPLLLKVLPRTT